MYKSLHKKVIGRSVQYKTVSFKEDHISKSHISKAEPPEQVTTLISSLSNCAYKKSARRQDRSLLKMGEIYMLFVLSGRSWLFNVPYSMDLVPLKSLWESASSSEASSTTLRPPPMRRGALPKEGSFPRLNRNTA